MVDDLISQLAPIIYIISQTIRKSKTFCISIFVFWIKKIFCKFLVCCCCVRCVWQGSFGVADQFAPTPIIKLHKFPLLTALFLYPLEGKLRLRSVVTKAFLIPFPLKIILPCFTVLSLLLIVKLTLGRRTCVVKGAMTVFYQNRANGGRLSLCNHLEKALIYGVRKS